MKLTDFESQLVELAKQMKSSPDVDAQFMAAIIYTALGLSKVGKLKSLFDFAIALSMQEVNSHRTNKN